MSDGYSDIAERYALIKPLLERYRRPFTVLDLGAFEGAFTFQIARDFPQAVCIAIEQDPIIVEKAREAYLSNVIVLNRKVSTEDLRLLCQCENFDVVLAMNFLHHCDDHLTATAATINLGWDVVVQTPYPDDEGACGQDKLQLIYVHFVNAEAMAHTVQFEGHMPRPLFYLSHYGDRMRLSRSSLESPTGNEGCVLASLFGKSIVLEHKNILEPTPWIYGFNLANFCYLGGKWPTKERVLQMLHEMPLPEKRHGDINVHNIIIDGSRAHLIDGGEDWATGDDEAHRQAVIRKVEELL